MALATYANLKTSIANWLNRTDLTTEIAEDFIVLAEKDFNSKLRIGRMIESNASFTIDSETETLPTGFLQVRDFYILEGGTKHALEYITPAQMDQIRGSSTTGMPKTFTILGDNFRFAPIPSSSYTGVINYYKEFTALSDSNDIVPVRNQLLEIDFTNSTITGKVDAAATTGVGYTTTTTGTTTSTSVKDRKSTRLNSSHSQQSRMPSSA